jgi:hypothetical protein
LFQFRDLLGVKLSAHPTSLITLIKHPLKKNLSHANFKILVRAVEKKSSVYFFRVMVGMQR